MSGTYSLVVAIDSGLLASAKQEKAELIALYSNGLKGRSSGVILMVLRSSLALIPLSQKVWLSTKILLSSAPAELVRMVFPTALGLKLCSSV